MKITDCQMLMVSIGGASPKRLEAIATELRNAALLPKGGRGPWAPEVGGSEVSAFLLAVAGAERVQDAVATAQLLSGLVNPITGEGLIDRLSAYVTGGRDIVGLRHIRVSAAARTAEVTVQSENGHRSVEYFCHTDAIACVGFEPTSQGAGYIGRIGHIGGALLHQISIEFRQTDEELEGEIVNN